MTVADDQTTPIFEPAEAAEGDGRARPTGRLRDVEAADDAPASAYVSVHVAV